ncbi:MAG: hypothetical protein LBS03_02825 [Bacteroidales bacterium]|jgi:uncharacterized protein (DUF608 family)|nr:hypothetical protein [Bacteroidales bacterium]
MKIIVYLFGMMVILQFACKKQERHRYNGIYENACLDRIAFPVGGMGAGMFCVEGTGAISHVSLRHRPELFHEPCMFAAIHVKGLENGTKVLEKTVPDWKKFGGRETSLGKGGTTWGLPRFDEGTFNARFPFADIALKNSDMPLDVAMKAWSPFIPTDADHSGLPAGAIEYTFRNTSDHTVEAVFSYSSRNFMYVARKGASAVKPVKNGFILSQTGEENEPYHQGDFAVFTDDTATKVDLLWFRGGWFDPLTIRWNEIVAGTIKENAFDPGAPGGSLFVPFRLEPKKEKTVRLYMTWYVPYSNLRIGQEPLPEDIPTYHPAAAKSDSAYRAEAGSAHYRPWYSKRFKNIEEVCDYWATHYDELKKKTQAFTDAFYRSTLPPEVLEAVAANLTILKSPTVFRQYDGRLWNWEGCGDTWGSCHGSCTHVWNYAQAIPHLFPDMERTLRETEFLVSQDSRGHQAFRTNLPIRPARHDFHAAADGQLGGIMKVYREWRISGNSEWLQTMYPAVRQSMDYCISAWDPRESGALEEPHHNTYDIEFWGPDGMCTGFYAGALQAIVLMGKAMNDEVGRYEALLKKSRAYLEEKLYDGEYFIQDIRWKDLKTPDPTKAQSFRSSCSTEAIAILEKEGPKYQYGKGCLSDGILGSWMARVCGMPDVVDENRVTGHLNAVYRYNLKKSLKEHANPQRPTFAMGDDGGLLLCSWPKGGKPSLPFVYSDEVWTGIEYQVASHLMFEGEIKKGLEIVRTCRNRYDGRIRNPFNEYECGAWYARAMASYGLLEGLTGIRYDAIDKTLYVDARMGNNFISFLSTGSGFGNAGLKNGQPFLDVAYGTIEVKKYVVSGKTTNEK